MQRVAAVLALVAKMSLGACPAGWTGDVDGDACFRIPADMTTFVECQDRVCSGLGGTLASIRSGEEQRIVQDLMDQQDEPRVYIGLFEAGEDESNDWEWVDGWNGDYTHWNPGEPNEFW